jgi:hypothetical protein
MGRRNKRKRDTQACHEFKRAGVCKYGDNCQYSHDTAVLESSDSDGAYKRELPVTGSIIRRSFWQFLAVNGGTKGETVVAETAPCVDQYVHMHPNEIAIVGLAETHDLIRNAGSREIDSILFEVKGQNLANMSVSGKKKRGAVKCKASTTICEIKCKDGTVYQIKACVEASLIQINPRLLAEPELVMKYPLTLGFLAIFQSKRKGLVHSLKGSLWSMEEFAKLRKIQVYNECPTKSAATTKDLFQQNRFLPIGVEEKNEQREKAGEWTVGL